MPGWHLPNIFAGIVTATMYSLPSYPGTATFRVKISCCLFALLTCLHVSDGQHCSPRYNKNKQTL